MQASINLLQAAKDVKIVGIDSVRTGQVAGVIEQFICPSDRPAQARWRSFPRGVVIEQLAQAHCGVPQRRGDERTHALHGQNWPEVGVNDECRESGHDDPPNARACSRESPPVRAGARQEGKGKR